MEGKGTIPQIKPIDAFSSGQTAVQSDQPSGWRIVLLLFLNSKSNSIIRMT